ncbi:hypothetical protein [Sulfurimonas sp.]
MRLSVAVDGKDGLEKFNIYNPDGIFTDINMPRYHVSILVNL